MSNFIVEYSADFIPYQICPKCKGQGIVAKPPHIPGDVGVWSSSELFYTCDVCNGEKIIPIHILEPQKSKL